MAFKEEYILSVDKFDKKYIEDKQDLANILFDEYMLDYSFVNNKNMLKVFVHNDEDVIKLRKMIRKYSNDKKYANELIGDTNESIKNIIYNKMENRRFNTRARRSSLSERMNERFSRSNRTARPLRRGEIAESFDERISRRLKRVEESNRPLRFSRTANESRRFARPSFSRVNEGVERRQDRKFHVLNESIIERLKARRAERLNEQECEKKCPTTYEGKKIEKMTKAEKRSAAAQVRKDIKEAQKLLKQREKDGRSTKAIEAKIEKLQCLLDCLTKKEEIKESLRSRFARNRRMFESEEDTLDTEDETSDEKTAEDDEDNSDSEDSDNTDTEETSDEEFDDVDVKAITLKVLNKNVDKLKDALIEAGVEEDDIEVTDAEDAEDDDEVGIKVDVNSFDALKSYCDGIGINLEEELGGDIVSDDEESNDDESGEEETEETPADASNDEEDDNFTDADIDDMFK